MMIFAAGFGTRMRPLTDHTPKPLIKVGGKALLDHAVDQAKAASIENIVVNTHYFADQVTDHFSGQNITISHEIDTVMDTGGGLRYAMPLLTGKAVFTMNSDAVWTGRNPFEELNAAWDPDKMDALLLLANPENATGHKGMGSFDVSSHSALTRGTEAVYLGAQIIKTDLLNDISEKVFSLNVVWDRIIADGRLFGAWHSGGWCDVGYPDAIPIAEKLLKNG